MEKTGSEKLSDGQVHEVCKDQPDPGAVVMTKSCPVSSHHHRVGCHVPHPAPRPAPFSEHQDHLAKRTGCLEVTEGGLKASLDRAEDSTSQGKRSEIKESSPS